MMNVNSLTLKKISLVEGIRRSNACKTENTCLFSPRLEHASVPPAFVMP